MADPGPFAAQPEPLAADDPVDPGQAPNPGRSRGRRGRGRGRRGAAADSPSVEPSGGEGEPSATIPLTDNIQLPATEEPNEAQEADAPATSAPTRRGTRRRGSGRTRGGRTEVAETAASVPAGEAQETEEDQIDTQAASPAVTSTAVGAGDEAGFLDSSRLPDGSDQSALTEPVVTDAVDEVDATEAAESADEELPIETPARGRGRTRAPASLITVNIGVPRGLGRRVNSKLIDQVIQTTMRHEGWQTPAVLDVHIVDDEEIREVNATRRGVDEATDVLSFPLLELRPGQGITEDFFVLPPEEVQHLGEILISFPRVESQADEAGHSRERELAFLTVHAMLHILGYDHENDEGRRQMRRREEEVLGELGLRRNGS